VGVSAEPVAEPAFLEDMFGLPVLELVEPEGPTVPPTFRDLALSVYRGLEAAGGLPWANAIPEERAALVADLIVRAGAGADDLERRGYAGPAAMAHYLADMGALATNLDGGAGLASTPADAERELPDLADVGAMAPPANLEREYLGGLLRAGKVLAIASQEGLGKSMVRKEIEHRLAAGTGALFGRYPVLEAVTVGTIDEENGPDEEWRRDEAMLPAVGLTREDLAGRYRRASFLGLNLADPVSQAYIRRQVAAGLNVLFLDTGGAMVDEEYGQPLKAAVRFLRALRRESPDLAVVLLVHMVKPSRDPKAAGVKRRVLTDVMGQWTRQADVVAVMSDLGADRFRWELVKRRGVPRSAGVVDYSSGIAQWVADVDDDEVTSTRESLRVLRAIGAGADSWQAVATGTGIGKNPVFAAIRELRAEGLIHPDTPYRLTVNGLEALG
jgi:hypothetical protein